MKTVLVFGTFDRVHKGHVYLFDKAKSFGDVLTVVVARDDTVELVKGKRPVENQEQRMADVQAQNSVDKVILGSDKKNKAEIVLDIKPDVICLGYDQRFFIDSLHDLIKEKNLNIEVHTLEPFEETTYKSSLLNK